MKIPMIANLYIITSFLYFREIPLFQKTCAYIIHNKSAKRKEIIWGEVTELQEKGKIWLIGAVVYLAGSGAHGI